MKGEREPSDDWGLNEEGEGRIIQRKGGGMNK